MEGNGVGWKERSNNMVREMKRDGNLMNLALWDVVGLVGKLAPVRAKGWGAKRKNFAPPDGKLYNLVPGDGV